MMVHAYKSVRMMLVNALSAYPHSFDMSDSSFKLTKKGLKLLLDDVTPITSAQSIIKVSEELVDRYVATDDEVENAVLSAGVLRGLLEFFPIYEEDVRRLIQGNDEQNDDESDK